jgi:L-fuculose-phosphate aldolase
VSEEALRRELSSLCRALHARGWVANHDGNVSVRLDADRYLASPTAVSKADVTPESLVVVDGEGKVVAGTRRVFSEISLHLACFRARPDVRWVVHAHPPTATGWAVVGRSFFDPPFMAEPVVSLGARVPVVPFLAPGADAGPLAEHLHEADAVLLGGHGALTVGADAETALLRMELIEHLARIALTAHQLGGPTPLSPDVVEALLAARAKAGLGPQGRGTGSPAAPPVTGPRPDVSRLVQDALRRFS